MEELVILEERGSHLLVRAGGRFAVVERRGDGIYALHDGGRMRHPDTEAGIRAAVGASGWHEEAAARQIFSELVERGEQLARRIW